MKYVPALFLACFIPGVLFAEETAEQVKEGPEIEAGVTVVTQQLDSENSEIDKDLTASADLVLQAEAGPGKLYLYLEGSTTPDTSASSIVSGANADAGTAVDRDGDGRVQISELYYIFLNSRMSLNTGVIDLTAFADASLTSNCERTQFVSAPLVNNPAIQFPDYVPAVVFTYAEEDEPGFIGVLSGTHGIGDNPKRTYDELFDLGKDIDGLSKGLFALTELGLPVMEGLRLGAWLSTDEQEEFATGEVEDFRLGLYANLDGRFGESTLWSSRLGWNEGEESAELGLFASFAVEQQFGDDSLGVGAAWQGISGDFADSLEAEGLDAKDTVLVELYYRWQLDEHWGLTPHAQFWSNPNFVDDGEGLGSSAWVFGLRLQYNI